MQQKLSTLNSDAFEKISVEIEVLEKFRSTTTTRVWKNLSGILMSIVQSTIMELHYKKSSDFCRISVVSHLQSSLMVNKIALKGAGTCKHPPMNNKKYIEQYNLRCIVLHVFGTILLESVHIRCNNGPISEQVFLTGFQCRHSNRWLDNRCCQVVQNTFEGFGSFREGSNTVGSRGGLFDADR